MSSGVIGTNDVVSGSKIQPLDAELKKNVSHDEALSGSVGTDHDIDQSKIPPLSPSTSRDQHPHVEPHATLGSVGRDGTIDSSKIEPLAASLKKRRKSDTSQGLDDEAVDAARIEPMGEVRQ